jgi:Uma2 family endonuclease
MIFRLLDEYAQRSGNGIAFGDNTEYRCFADDATRLRKPDVSWFSKLRAPKTIASEPFGAAPDLIVEVISPREGASKTEKKVQQFFDAGTSEAWIVYPDVNVLHRHFADGRNGRRYRVDDEIDGSPLLPGFSFKIADVLARLP